VRAGCGFSQPIYTVYAYSFQRLACSSACWQTGCHRLSSVFVVLIRHFYPAGDQLWNCGVSGLRYSELISEGRIKKCRRDNNLRASRPQLYPARAGFQVCACGLHYVMSQTEAPRPAVTPKKTYWSLVALAPLSIFTADTGGPPILVYLFFSLAAVAAVRLARTSKSAVQKSIALLATLGYGSALVLFLYMPLKYSYGLFGESALNRGSRHNMAIDTDGLSAGFRRPTVRRSLLR
jgi:hypothetical protein